jgi:HNH endonuclease.
MKNIITKKCTKCGTVKLRSEFYPRGKNVQSWCKECAKKCVISHRSRYQESDEARAKRLKRKAAYRERNRERLQEQSKKYWKANGEKYNLKSHEKRASGRVSWQDWLVIKKQSREKCSFPGCERTDIVIDHVKPIVLGGTHTADNLQPLCSLHNQKKHADHVDYRPTLNFLKRERKVQNGC